MKQRRDEMSKDDEVLETIKELAKSKGNRIPMPAIYRSVVQKGTYTSDKHIRNALKRLEMRGKIKTGGMNQLELLIEGLD